MSYPGRNPAPLTAAQIWALLRAATRELLWGLHQTTREMRAWRARAERIPCALIREDALYALNHKRTHADGAALFSILPRRRNKNLVRLLIAYELILDFLDNVSERHRAERNGRELHLALIDAVDPDRAPADYYRHHPWKDDGGYLRALVETCQHRCRALPSFELIRLVVGQEAGRTQVLALNHLPDPAVRDAALRQWAAAECPDDDGLTWYELGGAASASLVVLALLTLAADRDITSEDIERTRLVYWPWMSLVAVMLDSYADQAEDELSGDHSYVGHYPDRETRVCRLAECIERASNGARSLPDGRRHAIILAAMVAMYLSKDSAVAPALADDTKTLARAGGSLSRALLPVLRLWRTAYSHRGA
jgi:tetraprenyl-beta-curcumene synthase